MDENGERPCDQYGVLVSHNERHVQVGGDDGGATVWTRSLPLDRPLRADGRDGKFGVAA